jgi:hypothetical protein
MDNKDLLRTLIFKHSDRLGIDLDVAMRNALEFAQYVGLIENNGETQGKNPVSSAKGLYQFIDGSVAPAMNRLSRSIGWYPWMQRKNPNDMSREQQTLMFLGDILEKHGSDLYVPGILRGEKEDMLNAYLKLHHTNPDVATVRRAKRIIYGHL